ncbi:MAG: transaldolase [Campylobacterota bacterium]|nr:transaldolase [Campylobacterota bacterium]
MYIETYKFSLWADFIERDFLENKFKDLLNKKIINGATSNPAIFKQSILTSEAYKEQIKSLGDIGAKQKYEAIAIKDITKAADILLPLYEAGDDGFVSIEVDPFLCDNADATIEEGKRLFKTINRPNVMIKVPATTAGYKAMQELVSSGIHVNATLIFKEEQAKECLSAFEAGQNRTSANVHTVISVFVSRIDRALDEKLNEVGITPSLSGIYNAASIYNMVEALHVKNNRTLFASTGVKGDTLQSAYYIDELIGKNCVNTAPIETIDAFVLKGNRELALPLDEQLIKEHFLKIAAAKIDYDEVLNNQVKDGLDAFKVAFNEILTALK